MSSNGRNEHIADDDSSPKLLNCWEARNCGREIDGAKVELDGVCPAATANNLEGVNRGLNGGRVCWAVAGTMGTKVCNLTFSEKIVDCIMCDFYQTVLLEEPEFEIYPAEKMDL
ncbi:MAG: two-CW domain-containing protein [Candidatus Thorarchaeota archaeon]|jgi:hypothetical protein